MTSQREAMTNDWQTENCILLVFTLGAILLAGFALGLALGVLL